MGKRPKKRHFSKEDILILVDLLQKITEFCKVIILQLKKTISGEKKRKQHVPKKEKNSPFKKWGKDLKKDISPKKFLLIFVYI